VLRRPSMGRRLSSAETPFITVETKKLIYSGSNGLIHTKSKKAIKPRGLGGQGTVAGGLGYKQKRRPVLQNSVSISSAK